MQAIPKTEILNICDIMGLNQSHITEHKKAEILSKNAKIYQF